MVTPALGPEDQVIVHANTIGGAALTLMDISKGKLECPDVVVVGGRLEDDGAYLRQPAVVTEQVEVPGRTLWRKRASKLQTVTTALLPVPRPDGAMILPSSHGSPVSPAEVARYIEYLDILTRASGCAAYVLSHLTKILLPEGVRVIGVSSYNTMEDLPIDVLVERHFKNIPLMREAIQRTR